MRNIKVLGIILATTLAALSCQKESVVTDSSTSLFDKLVIRAEQEGGSSKTTVDSGTGTVYWEPEDSINVFYGSNMFKFITHNQEKSRIADFVSTEQNVILGVHDGISPFIVGLYPFDKSAVCDGSTITTTLGPEQTASEGTFSNNTFITMGKYSSDASVMSFYNVCGGIRFKIAKEGIDKVVFLGNNNEVLAGQVKLAFGEDGYPEVKEVLTGSGFVGLTCREGFKTDVWYYLVTLPVELSKGYSVFLISSADDTIEAINYDEPIEIKRSCFGSITDFKKGMEWGYTFFSYCMSTYDADGDFRISESEAEAVTELSLNNCGISSLKGIEIFKNLQSLECYNNSLTSLDISNNTALTHLDCCNNKLTNLDVSKNTALTYLVCEQNQLTSLDVSNNTALTYLDFYDNQLTSLDVSNNTALETLGCGSNQLTSLDVSNNTALTNINCDWLNLTNLDVSKNTALTKLRCCGNKLTNLDVSNNTALTYLDCQNNELTSIDISRNTALTTLDCGYNQLTVLDVSKHTALTSLKCRSCQLTSLDVSKNTALTSLDCGINQLTSLDVSKNTALTSLICFSNQLVSLDVSNDTALTYLDCKSNRLTSLDISKNTALTRLYCTDNQINELWFYNEAQKNGMRYLDTDPSVTFKYYSE